MHRLCNAQQPGVLTLTAEGAAGLAAALTKLRAAGAADALDAYLDDASEPAAPPQQPAAPPPQAPQYSARPPHQLAPQPSPPPPVARGGGNKRVKTEGDADADAAPTAQPAVCHVGDGERLAVALLLGDVARLQSASSDARRSAEQALRAALAALHGDED